MEKTLSDLLDAWWLDYRPTIADTTAYNKLGIIRLHILPYCGNKTVSYLKVSDLEYILKKTPHQQIEIRKILVPALRWGITHRWCKKNIMLKIQRPKYKPAEVDIFKVDELEALLTYLQGRWLWLPVYLSSRTGLRRGEVCGLQWDDIDIDRGYLVVRRTISAVSSHDLFIRPPKTKKSNRRVDLDKETLEILRQRKETAKTLWVCEAPRRAGGMPNPWYIVKMMHDACDAAKISRHTFHSLRHTHATILLAEGVHPKIVSERLGHSNIMITIETYSHIIPTMQAVAVSAIEHAFSAK